jgi:hypothetical protein
MKIISLAISVALLIFGCYQDKGPTINVIYDGMGGPPFKYQVGDGDWYLDNGKWIDAADVVTPADANSIAILEEYLGPKKVAHQRKWDK